MLLRDFFTQLKAVLGMTETKTIVEITDEIPSVAALPITASLVYRTVATYDIPEGVKNIGSSAFENCTSLSSVTIPDSVTKIESSAFAYCRSLTSITIPTSVTKIELHAFYDCTIHFRFRCSESEVPSGYPWEATSATAEYNYTGDE